MQAFFLVVHKQTRVFALRTNINFFLAVQLWISPFCVETDTEASLSHHNTGWKREFGKCFFFLRSNENQCAFPPFT